MKISEATIPLGRWLLALIASVTLSGCTEHPSSAPTPPSNADTAGATTPDPAADTVKANASPGGVPTAYVAYFDAGQLQRITETRQPEGAGAARGEYVFYGARLMRYRGAALHNGASIELNFDTQGVLTSSNTNASTPIGDEEVGTIRNRAQLLRSVALARRSTQSHMTH